MSTFKRSFAAAFGVLIAASASAQQNQPAQPQTGISTGELQFQREQPLGAWRVSKFVGVDVLGANGEKLGDIREVLVGEDGRVTTVVIGVGGVIGIGERLVGVPYAAMEWASRNIGATRNPEANREGARTGAASDTTGSTSSRDAFVSRGGAPNHAVLRITKAQIEAAPPFAYAGRSDATSNPQAEPGRAGSNDPKPATPPGVQPNPQQ
jgi:hypothetical protein